MFFEGVFAASSGSTRLDFCPRMRHDTIVESMGRSSNYQISDVTCDSDAVHR
jgi:hypothetical protein